MPSRKPDVHCGSTSIYHRENQSDEIYILVPQVVPDTARVLHRNTKLGHGSHPLRWK